MINKDRDIFLTFFWIGLSLFVMISAYHLELGNFQDPGPGLMPFLIGVVLFLLSSVILAASFLRSRSRSDSERMKNAGRISFWKVGSVFGSLVIYGLILEKIGYLVATWLLLLFLFKIAGSRKWRTVLLSSVLTVFITYFFFTSFGLRFPKGIFKGF